MEILNYPHRMVSNQSEINNKNNFIVIEIELFTKQSNFRNGRIIFFLHFIKLNVV